MPPDDPQPAPRGVSTMPGYEPGWLVGPAAESDIAVLARHRAAMFRDMGQLVSHQEGALERATESPLRSEVKACRVTKFGSSTSRVFR